MRISSLLSLTCLLLPPLQAAGPVLRVVKGGASEATLTRNGGFEIARAELAADWNCYENGYRLAPGAGRQGGQALMVDCQTEDRGAGACQQLQLNRSSARPLVVRGWSKAQDVSGSPDNNYSLYVDLVYADGTTLWGQTANFRCGTHDWEARERVILPDKPVKSLTIYCLLRGHTGRAWFDDITVEELTAGGDAMLYQGVPMQTGNIKPPQGEPTASVATADDLRLAACDNQVKSVVVSGRELATAAISGFLARDVAMNSDVFEFASGACPELGLTLKAGFQAQPNHLAVQGRVSSTTGKDRAVTLLFALPVDAKGWYWGRDIRHAQAIEGPGEFSGTVQVCSGATGTQSLYPIAAIWDERTGLALGLDMAHPAQYRLGYHAGTEQLFVAYDFGLVNETERFPSSADFRFVIFRFDPAWGFRAAFQKYMEIFPDHFAVRSRDQGMWMPFTDVSTVDGWEDFGFRYHEGNNKVPWDDEHGVLSFRYTEPMTWWMAMKPEVPRTPAEAVKVRDELARGKNPHSRRLAELTRTAAMFDESGEPALQFRDTPWCNGAVWSLNPNPHLPGEFNAATVHWNASLKETLYGPGAKGRLDGEYLDSLEGYVTAELNFRREHFRHTTVPLTFDRSTKQPALGKGLAVFEFTKWMSEDVHRMGKLMFANGVPYRFTFLAPWLDVLGTETDWLRAGHYSPAAETTMNLWRTLSGRKPYLLLMNTDYNALTPDLVEKYFQRALFYGMFPGMFSHNASENPYWQNPAWYNRDRALFKRYQPLVKRIAEAGWHPVTHARCNNSRILLERFGPDAAGAVYLTLFNDTGSDQKGAIVLEAQAATPGSAGSARELISGQLIELEAGKFTVSLEPQTARLVQVK